MLLEVSLVRGVARDLQGSGRVVNDAAARVAGSRPGFDVGKAGRDYRECGERLEEGLDGARRYLFAWANCVYDCGSALQASADSCVGVDQSTATTLGAVEGAFR